MTSGERKALWGSLPLVAYAGWVMALIANPWPRSWALGGVVSTVLVFAVGGLMAWSRGRALSPGTSAEASQKAGSLAGTVALGTFLSAALSAPTGAPTMEALGLVVLATTYAVAAWLHEAERLDAPQS